VEPRIKILYVTVSMELGGTERQLYELAAGLDRERFHPHVCCLRGGGPLSGEFDKIGIPVVIFQHPRLGSSQNVRNLHIFLSQVRALVRLYREVKPSIVHAFLPIAYVVAGLAARLARVPVLVTSRRGLGYNLERHFFFRQLGNMVNCWADAVVANSEAVRDDTLARERIDAAKLSVIYNGVKAPAGCGSGDRRADLGKEIAGPIVCCVANFFPYKGHLELLAAASTVVKSFPGAAFVFVGDGIQRPEIEHRMRELGLGENVVMLGSRSDARTIMGFSDMVVLASHEEGFPNVILEAMAVGKPVVATRVGGVPEAVEDGYTGLLVPPHDPESLAAAILRLLSNRDVAIEMGRRGLERVREHFTIDRMVKSYETLYEKLMG